MFLLSKIKLKSWCSDFRQQNMILSYFSFILWATKDHYGLQKVIILRHFHCFYYWLVHDCKRQVTIPCTLTVMPIADHSLPPFSLFFFNLLTHHDRNWQLLTMTEWSWHQGFCVFVCVLLWMPHTRLTNQIRTSNNDGAMRWCPMLAKLCLENSVTTSDVANKDNNVLHLMLRACKAELW